ncbi:hypothetical protein R1T08_17200 [Streptomyces sp. SBC-4]|nr:hypothetical protein [Streptomyces sp. SBC-4]MDV5145898.1 hypothetical protein [Streptomyces sp. SBC-4]
MTNFSEFSDPDYEEGWGTPSPAHQEQFDALAAKYRQLQERERARRRAADLRAAADTMAAEGITWGGPDHADGWNAAIARLRELAEEER